MERYLQTHILRDLPEKVVLLTGPRQCGKTTLAKQLYLSFDYFNYDSAESRMALQKLSWDRSKQLVIFDELHKMKGWKRWLKGVFDTEGIPPEILVTGSARLDVHKKIGDSLAGRYFQFRLHPLDLKEIIKIDGNPADHVFDQLWRCGGFPQPFLKDNQIYYRRWQNTHLEVILRQDLIDLYSGRDIQAIETLVLLLKERVGSTISYANLARDLERDANTIKRWLQLLENLYIVFRVSPYHKNIARSLLKEPKYYFYDFACIEGNDGAKLENLVACALLKELQYIEDTQGIKTSLHYLRTKDGYEMDFVICKNRRLTHVIEVKSSDGEPAKNFTYFHRYIQSVKQIQLVKELKRETTYPNGVEIRSLIGWLAHFSFE